MIKHILWDFEGTLFDTSPAKTYAMSRTMAELGFSIPLNTIDSLIRQSYDCCIEILRKRYQFSDQEVHAKFLRYYAAIPPRNQVLFPGVMDVCSWICERGGSNLIVANQDPEDCRRFLCEHAAEWYFNGIYAVSTDDTNTIMKTLVDLMGQYDLEPEATLMVSRKEKFILAAKQVGMKTCRYGIGEEGSASDWQVSHYEQLLSLLRVYSHMDE
jgi:phosphoglycolate phosphatase-like HAD superfamily hydrolase